MSAFVFVVPTALLARVLLVIPSRALFFVVLLPPRLYSLGQFKGDSLLGIIGYWVSLGHKPDCWVAHRVACYIFVCLFPTASAPPPFMGELSAYCALVPSVYLGGGLILFYQWACVAKLGLGQMG